MILMILNVFHLMYGHNVLGLEHFDIEVYVIDTKAQQNAATLIPFDSFAGMQTCHHSTPPKIASKSYVNTSEKFAPGEHASRPHILG